MRAKNVIKFLHQNCNENAKLVVSQNLELIKVTLRETFRAERLKIILFASISKLNQENTVSSKFLSKFEFKFVPIFKATVSN